MTGRRSHGRLSALNGVVHQGRSATLRAAVASNRPTVLTLRLNQELADPFRRDAFKPKPTRFLEKYRSLSG